MHGEITICGHTTTGIGTGGIVADDTIIHRKVAGGVLSLDITGFRIYTAAAACAAIPGDGPVIQIEGAGKLHAAAVTPVTEGMIVGDAAVIHVERTMGQNTDTALVLTYCIIADNIAAIHVKGRIKLVVLHHIHATASFAADVRDLAVICAIRQGKGNVIANGDHIKVAAGLDSLSIQAQHRATDRLPRAGQRHIILQVIVARSVRKTIRLIPRRKIGLRIGVAAHSGAAIPAAEIVLVLVGLHSQHQQTIAVADLISIIIAGELFFVSLAQCRT